MTTTLCPDDCDFVHVMQCGVRFMIRFARDVHDGEESEDAMEVYLEEPTYLKLLAKIREFEARREAGRVGQTK